MLTKDLFHKVRQELPKLLNQFSRFAPMYTLEEDSWELILLTDLSLQSN